MKPILFLLVVLQLTSIRGNTDEDDDYKGEYEKLNIQFKEEREKLNIAEQRLLEATKKLNVAEVKVLVLNKQLEANKQSSIVQNDDSDDDFKDEVFDLLKQLSEKLNNLEQKYVQQNNKLQAPTQFDRMPESCDDLRKIGHTLNGFYDVKGSKTIRSVYCNFTKHSGDPGMETAMGVVDVKSRPVYFHVQRNSSYKATGTTIPFEIERLNVGGGMNINSGIFTAPKSGIYYFSFSTVKEYPDTAGMFIDLYLNSNNIARAFSFATFGLFTASLSSTLSLKSGDRISLLLTLGQLYDSTPCYTNFNGILLQEEI